MLQTTETEILAPFEIWEVPLENGNTLKFHKPLILQPFWLPDDPDEPDENEYMAVRFSAFDLDAFGADYDELLGCITDEFNILWERYASAEDEELTEKYIKVKKNLLAALMEVANG